MQCSPHYSSVTILLHFFITQYLLKQKFKKWRKGYAHWQCNKQLQNQFTFRHSNIVSKAGCFRNKRSHLTHGFRGSKAQHHHQLGSGETLTANGTTAVTAHPREDSHCQQWSQGLGIHQFSFIRTPLKELMRLPTELLQAFQDWHCVTSWPLSRPSFYLSVLLLQWDQV